MIYRGRVLEGVSREAAIDAHLAWLAGRMPSEIHQRAQREAEPDSPVSRFFARHRSKRSGRPKRTAR